MATGGRLPYWVSNCFILIAFFFVLLKLIVEGKMNKNPNTIKKKNTTKLSLPERNLCPSRALVISVRDISVLYLHQMINAPVP